MVLVYYALQHIDKTAQRLGANREALLMKHLSDAIRQSSRPSDISTYMIEKIQRMNTTGEVIEEVIRQLKLLFKFIGECCARTKTVHDEEM